MSRFLVTLLIKSPTMSGRLPNSSKYKHVPVCIISYYKHLLNCKLKNSSLIFSCDGRGKIISMYNDWPWTLSNTASKCIMKKIELAFEILLIPKHSNFVIKLICLRFNSHFLSVYFHIGLIIVVFTFQKLSLTNKICISISVLIVASL